MSTKNKLGVSRGGMKKRKRIRGEREVFMPAEGGGRQKRINLTPPRCRWLKWQERNQKWQERSQRGRNGVKKGRNEVKSGRNGVFSSRRCLNPPSERLVMVLAQTKREGTWTKVGNNWILHAH